MYIHSENPAYAYADKWFSLKLLPNSFCVSVACWQSLQCPESVSWALGNETVGTAHGAVVTTIHCHPWIERQMKWRRVMIHRVRASSILKGFCGKTYVAPFSNPWTVMITKKWTANTLRTGVAVNVIISFILNCVAYLVHFRQITV